MLAALILAGGRATRLPGKLEKDAGGRPLLQRVYENVRAAGPVYVAAASSFAPQLDAALQCPIVIDRRPGEGPLWALYGALEAVREPRVFVVAGDMPFVSSLVAEELGRHWEACTQAVVPLNAQGRLEPLCALYDRTAFLTAATPVLRSGSGGVAAVVEGLEAKRVRLKDERVFASVNTPDDRRALLGV